MPGQEQQTQQEQQADPNVDVEGLQHSLNELVKAADAAEVSKSYGGTSVETGTHVDESGQTSGELPSEGDVGSVSELEIGKMQEAGVPGHLISEFVAFMRGKAGDDEEEEGEDPEHNEYGAVEDDKGKMKGKGKGKMKDGKAVSPTDAKKKKSEQPADEDDDQSEQVSKSMDQFRSDEDIAEAVDVSPFLEALTQRTAEQIDNMNKSLQQANSRQADVNQKMAKAVNQIGNTVKQINEVTEALNKRLQVVEREPVSKGKGARTQPTAQAMSKGMPNEASDTQSLSKSQIVNTLSYMNLEKGMTEINGKRTSHLISEFEAGNIIDQQTLGKVQGFLSSHPHEAETAKNYS